MAGSTTPEEPQPDDNNAPLQFVKLISADGHEFFLDKDVAKISKTMNLMLVGSFREAQDNVIRFPDMTGYILERVIQYLHYKAQYSHSTARIPEFVSALHTYSVTMTTADDEYWIWGGR
jgi:transcription elongation factor B subunit 1